LKPKTYAKYPFLSQSSQFIKEQDVSLSDLLYSDLYDRARERAYQKILQSVQREAPEPVEFSNASSFDSMSSLDDRAKIVNEVLSYVIARIIISCINDPFLIQWYAHYEASLIHVYLQGEDNETLRQVSSDLGLQYEQEDDDTFSLTFVDYLTFTKNFKTQDWKLVNRDLVKGRIILDRRQVNRLLLEVVRDHVISEFPRPVTDEIVAHFKDWSKRIKNEISAKKAEFDKFSSEEVDIDQFPPCIQSLMGRIGAGENISHEARFAIVSFANTIGMTKEDIIRIFSASPDFDLSKSQYQIDHIMGEISATEYTPPECSTMKSYGNCFKPDNLCNKEWMSHPLKYYRAKLKWKDRDAGKKEKKSTGKEAEEKTTPSEGEEVADKTKETQR
jgi:DNA primase large subunit